MGLRLSKAERERLQAEFLQKMAEDFERMFGPEQQAELVTFDQLESRAMQMGLGAARWAMEHHLILDVDGHAEPKQTSPCPSCGAACGPREAIAGPPPREVVTRAGKIEFSRTEYYCKPCRRVFFPSGQSLGTPDGRVQPERDPQDRVRWRKRAVVRPGE